MKDDEDRQARGRAPGTDTSPRPRRHGTSAASCTCIAARASARAGASSSATWRDGPEASVTRLLEGKCRPPGAPEPEEFERTAAVLGEAATASSDPGRLKAWWFYRLLFSPDPLGERLTLMWHNHFATSIQKVGDPALMRKQNETCRRLARKPFGELLEAMVRDPALLIWLDAPANRKGHPNENLARELMELFTLGDRPLQRGRRQGDRPRPDRLDRHRRRVPRGRRAARRRRQGDPGPDGPLERSGRRPDPAGSTRRRPIGWPGGSATSSWAKGPWARPSSTALADGLRSHHLDIGWARRDGAAIAGLLRRAEHPDAGARARSSTSSGRGAALELLDPPPSTLVLADWSARIGQDLFNPPNVGGWPGGRSWLSARSLIGRANFAAALVEGRGVGRDVPFDPIALAQTIRPQGRRRAAPIRFCAELLTGTAPDDRPTRAAGDRSPGAGPQRVGHAGPPATAVARLIAAPESQARLIVSDSSSQFIERSSHAHATRSLQDDAQRRGAGGSVPDGADLPGPDGAGGRAPDRDGRVLVVIQLDGGNDAINTLVPFPMRATRSIAARCGLDQKSLIKVNDRVGLHPGLREMGALLERGQLALVPGVGYPNPNRSHFESMAIWQTARLDPEEHAGPGWIGRGLDAQARGAARRRPAAPRLCSSATARLRPRCAADAPRRRHSIGSTTSCCPRDGLARPVQTRSVRRRPAMTSMPTSAGACWTPMPPRSAWPS